MSRFLKVLLAAVVLVSAQTLAPTAPAEAVYPNFKLTATFKSLSGKTIQWLSKTGRVLDSERITSNSQAITLTSSRRVSSVKQSTLQLINTSGGDYYGPVVLGWTSSTRVHTAVSFGSSTSVNYGTVSNKPITGTSVQGWAKASTNAKKSTSSTSKVLTTKIVKATSYKPKGVGTYGRANTGAPLSMPGIDEDSPLMRSLSIVTRSRIDNNNPENQYSGADPDGDGLPSFADVNDDGDAVIDAADSSTPSTPEPSPSAACESQATFNVFTNFKSTATNFAGNINAYGPGSFGITVQNPTEIVTALNNTLTMAIEKVTSVCGSSVTKWEIKGIGLPYAPASYVDITAAASGFDFQWAVGNASINSVSIAGLPEDPFTAANQISGQDALMQRITTANGKEYEFTSTTGFVFVSHPLPLEYKVVATGTDPTNTAWTSFFNVGNTATNYSNIAIGDAETVYIKMYRPQRLAMLGELDGLGQQATFMDIGGFRYTPDMPNAISGTTIGKCDAEMVSDSAFTDTALNTGTPPTIVIEWDISACFDARNNTPWPTAGVTFDADMQVEPAGPGGNSAQKIAFITR